MGLKRLSSRAIIGMFYQALTQDTGATWVPLLSMLFDSDQDSEEYVWLGQSPAMREFVGGRNAKGFRENGLTIKNKHFEATVQILVKWLRRDKTGQARLRIRELATRANSHWASLLSALIIAAEAQVCYDGQYFFDTDHSEGESGTQSNDIQVDISALPALVHGSTTAPSPEEMQQAIIAGIAAILGFKDDQGEPMNETASNFLVMTPTSLWTPASNSISLPRGTGVSEQKLPPNLNISVANNARLTWTDKFAIFRTDGEVKPFIRQQETDVQMAAKAEGSEFEFDNAAHQYGIDSWRNVGLGYWQHACLVTLI